MCLFDFFGQGTESYAFILYIAVTHQKGSILSTKEISPLSCSTQKVVPGPEITSTGFP